jgi:DNA end-binding protein Ku
MAPRTSWKGFIKLSLVSVPVKAYTANNTTEDVRLNQLHQDCNQRVKYKKVCPEHGELNSNEIVSGYEYAKGQYVIIEPSEVAKLRKESDKSISIDGFVKSDEIDSLYFSGKTYYLLPDGVAGSKPYALLHKGMVDADVNAMAQIVLSGRAQLVLLRPVDNMLVMSILQHEQKVKSIAEFAGDLETPEMTDEESALAATLISASYIGDVENLTKLIQMKIDGEEIVSQADPEEPKILNLMEALKRSVAQAQAAAGSGAGRQPAVARKKATKKADRKVAPSAAKKTRKKKSG